MKKTAKPLRKILAVIMAIVMLLLTGITAFAESWDDEKTFVSGDFKYYLYEDGTVSIVGYEGNAETLEIPATLDGHEVVSIAWYACNFCDSIKSVTIPDTVTEIGMGAFGGCPNLTSVNIPDSVEYIGMCAFDGCTSLISITVDENNKYYSSLNGVLFNKDKTELIQYSLGNTDTSYTIPDGVITIASRAFASCENLKNITIPNSVTHIGSETFSWCKNLTSISIPDGVTTISPQAFYRCENLTSIIISDSVKYIGHGAFFATAYYNDGSNWTDGVLYIGDWLIEANEVPLNYTIKAGTKHIADNAFEGCIGITNIKLPDSVESIGQRAFRYCINLTSITIPDSVTSISDTAFFGTAYYDSPSNWTDGVLYIGNHLIEADPEKVSGEYTVKAGTKVIADYAFELCHEITSVIIPNSVVTIGKHAFDWTNNLTSVTIGSGVKTIGECAFAYCTGLTSVTIPASVTYIGDAAFVLCDKLTDIYIYNKDCVIVDNSKLERAVGEDLEPVNGWTIPDTTVIHGYEGSTAEGYAKEYDREFAVIEKAIGDVNGDGRITTVDAKWILQRIAGTKDFSAAQEVDADLNSDGKVSIVDVKWVLQIVAGTRDAETLEQIQK